MVKKSLFLSGFGRIFSLIKNKFCMVKKIEKAGRKSKLKLKVAREAASKEAQEVAREAALKVG